MKYIFLLYSDSSKTKLLAAAYSEEQRNKVSQEYTAGAWFRYELDPIKEYVMYDDTEVSLDATFAEQVLKQVENEAQSFWKLGGVSVR